MIINLKLTNEEIVTTMKNFNLTQLANISVKYVNQFTVHYFIFASLSDMLVNNPFLFHIEVPVFKKVLENFKISSSEIRFFVLRLGLESYMV